MALGTLVDRDLRRVIYQVSLRGEAGLLGFELQQLAELLRAHAQLDHVVLDTCVVMPSDGALPYLAMTVNGLLPDDHAFLRRRHQRMGVHEEHDSHTINQPAVIARRVEFLSVKEREALNEAVSALYFNDSSKYRGTLWSIINGILGLDFDETNTFDENVWAHALNPDWTP